MPTYRLMLLCALVAVAGGCSIWYTQLILPASVASPTDDVSTVPASNNEEASAVPSPTTDTIKTKPAEQVAPSTLDKVSDAIGASALADDLAAIAESADTLYDDSSLQAQITSSEPASLTSAYGI